MVDAAGGPRHARIAGHLEDHAGRPRWATQGIRRSVRPDPDGLPHATTRWLRGDRRHPPFRGPCAAYTSCRVDCDGDAAEARRCLVAAWMTMSQADPRAPPHG